MRMGTRRRIVAGNWKMNLDLAGAVALTEAVASGATSSVYIYISYVIYVTFIAHLLLYLLLECYLNNK